MNKESILRMASGAIEERVDYEVSRVIDNILDPNTKPNAKRKIVLTLEFLPDKSRSAIGLSVTAKASLAPTEAVETTLCITSDARGEMLVAEMIPQVPGQVNMSGQEQSPPKILKLVAQK